MAAPTIAFDQRKTVRLGTVPGFGLITGLVTMSSYDNTHPEVTALTGKVINKTVTLRVVPDGVSSNGYAIRWDDATLSFKAYGSNGASPAALAEAANTTNVGTFGFVAFGQLG